MAGEHWSRSQPQYVSRRRLLARGGSLAALGVADWIAAACGGSSSNNKNATGGANTAPTSAGRAATAVPVAPSSGSPAASSPSATAAAAKVRRGGLLATAIAADYDNLDPHTYVPASSEETIRSMYENIVGSDAQGRYAPDGSVSAKWEQPSPTELLFTLRSGVKFHDGTDMTAEGVQWNFQDILDPARNSPRKAAFSVMDHMEVVDSTHLRIVLKQPTAGFFGDLSHPSSGIISRAAFDKLGAAGIKSQPVGTGPFQLKAWNRSASLEVQAFPQYWDKGADGAPLPYLGGIRWDILADTNVQAEALAGGKIQILTGMTTEQYDRFNKDKKYVIDPFVGDSMGGLFVNRTVAPFNETAGQIGNLQAVWIAIDRKKIIEVVYGGRGLPAYGGVSPSLHKWAYSGDALNVPKGPDLKKAKELLAQAGNPNGFDLPVITITPGSYTDEAQVAQAQLAQIGINVKINAVDVSTAVTKMWQVDRNLPAFWAGYSQTIDPNLKLSIAHGSKGAYAPEPDSYKTASEYFKTMDGLLAQGNATYDLAQRAAAYRQLEEANGGKYVGLIYLLHKETDNALAIAVQGYDHGSDNKKRYARVWLQA